MPPMQYLVSFCVFLWNTSSSSSLSLFIAENTRLVFLGCDMEVVLDVIVAGRLELSRAE